MSSDLLNTLKMVAPPGTQLRDGLDNIINSKPEPNSYGGEHKGNFKYYPWRILY